MPPPPDPTSVAPNPAQPPAGYTPVAPSPATSSLTGAFGTALQSGFSAVGNAVGTAASIGASVGSFGAASPAAGAIGSLAGGLFGEGGKIAAGAARAVSTLLVGNVTAGTTDNAYGQPLRPAQNTPQTVMPTGGTTYNMACLPFSGLRTK